jgi:hypothetical protein
MMSMQSTGEQRAVSIADLGRALMVAAVVVLLLVTMFAVFGDSWSGTYEIVPDPAGLLPF